MKLEISRNKLLIKTALFFFIFYFLLFFIQVDCYVFYFLKVALLFYSEILQIT